MSCAPSLIEEHESLLTAQTELTQHLLRFVEEQLVRAERAEAENERLMAALEVERAWWEQIGEQGLWKISRSLIEQRLEALETALEGKRG